MAGNPGEAYVDHYFNEVLDMNYTEFVDVEHPELIPGVLQAPTYAGAWAVRWQLDGPDSPFNPHVKAANRQRHLERLTSPAVKLSEIYYDEVAMYPFDIEPSILISSLDRITEIIEEHGSDRFRVGIRPTISDRSVAANILNMGDFIRFTLPDGNQDWRSMDGAASIAQNSRIIPFLTNSLETYRQFALTGSEALDLVATARREAQR